MVVLEGISDNWKVYSPKIKKNSNWNTPSNIKFLKKRKEFLSLEKNVKLI